MATSTRQRRQQGERRRGYSGLAQLSVVEHALCPLDERLSLTAPLVYETGYFRMDQNRHATWVPVRLLAQEGLSAADEFYLWGLLALTFAQPNPSFEFWATPHWCLKQLGCLDAAKGGSQYAQFRSVLRRLAGVTYFCRRFYDPLRGEERDRAFGFLKYDLPVRDDSSRAWRIVWDPLFFEYCQAKGGRMSFDLQTYRSLDAASRRLFLLLTKIFWRRETSPRFDVWHLGIHGLGFSNTLDIRNLKVKLARAIEKLVELQVIALPPGAARVGDLFEKKAVGSYAVRLQRGRYFESGREASAKAKAATDSPLLEPLAAIGFDERMSRWILTKFPGRLVEVWSDVTLAAMESKGERFFTGSPQAYFLDNLKAASAGTRTPPDWWHELKKRRARAVESDRRAATVEQYRAVWERAKRKAFKAYLQQSVGKAEYDRRVMQFLEIYQATMPQRQAVEAAVTEAERHLRSGFQFPDLADWSLQHNAVGDVAEG